MITGTLKLERFNKDYRLLERRIQPMRSWTKGLIELLYIAHAQIAPAVAYVTTGDIDKTPRYIYGLNTNIWGSGFYGAHLNGLVSSPPGMSIIESLYPYGAKEFVLGCDVGIQVGNDATAVTPTDKGLIRRIGHGTRVADGGNATFEAMDVNDDQSRLIITDNNTRVAQPFVPTQDFRCSSVELKLFKVLAPAGPLTVEICTPSHVTPANNGVYPSTTVLATGTIASAALGASPGAFVACNFGTAVDLYAGHVYFIVCHSAGVDGANYFGWRYDAAGTTYDRNLKTGTTGSNIVCYAVNTTNNWVAQTINDGQCQMFRTIGRSIGEFEYGGCEVVNRVTADPNDAFDIRRFFYNRSGAAINVNEVGITTRISSLLTGQGEKAIISLLARDALGAPIAVANTEFLLVTYTPAITV